MAKEVRVKEGLRRIVRVRLLALAVLLSLLVLTAAPEAMPAFAAPALHVLFAVQVLLALVLVAGELVRGTRAEAEARALRDLGAVLLTTHNERQRAVRERDELGRTVAELRSLTDHLRDELRARDDAMASAVHELRNPLTSVQAYGQLMSRNLHSVQRQVAQLERLIADLLQLPGARPFTEEDVDLGHEARDAAQRLRLLSDREVDVVVDDEGPHVVRGDAGRLGQVLDNLLGNAAKFSPPDRPIQVSVRRSGDEVVIAVIDHGEGIRGEELSLIFERYYRARDGRGVPGEGIGLAVSREIVLAHRGRIWAMSAGPGKGSTFFTALPAVAPVDRPLRTAQGSTPSPAS